MTLTEFLLARIAEDEAVARAASPGPWEWSSREEHDSGIQSRFLERANADDIVVPIGGRDTTVLDATAFSDTRGYLVVDDTDADYIARHHPSRVLAECEAKRRIVEPWEFGADEDNWRFGIHADAHEWALKALALPYADHPDYDPAWNA